MVRTMWPLPLAILSLESKSPLLFRWAPRWLWSVSLVAVTPRNELPMISSAIQEGNLRSDQNAAYANDELQGFDHRIHQVFLHSHSQSFCALLPWNFRKYCCWRIAWNIVYPQHGSKDPPYLAKNGQTYLNSLLINAMSTAINSMKAYNTVITVNVNQHDDALRDEFHGCRSSCQIKITHVRSSRIGKLQRTQSNWLEMHGFVDERGVSWPCEVWWAFYLESRFMAISQFSRLDRLICWS